MPAMRTMMLLAFVALAAAGSASRADSSGATSSVIGKPAPDFTLTDLDGKEVQLASFKGKVVVLEWFNPRCPFVKASHTAGSLVDTAQRHMKDGVVWLGVNSGAAGKEGADVKMNVEDFATEEVLDGLGIEDAFELTGLYQGVNLADRSVLDPIPHLSQVFLYRRPILDEWSERGDVTLFELITHVLVHEIGHHFGLSDADIHAAEED